LNEIQKQLKIIIATARPGMVIGRSGEGVDKTLKKDIVKILQTFKKVNWQRTNSN
jgi:ribosomal protein S3